MKYIILEKESEQDSNSILQIPIIFPNNLVHQDVAKLMENYGKPVSAGFCNLPISVPCFGESETLNIKSKPEDNMIIGMIDYLMFRDK